MNYDPRRAAELRARYMTEAIQTATPAGRLTMLLDALEMDLARADDQFASVGDIKKISDLLIHAQEILALLADTLDLSVWEGALALKTLYQHLHTELVMANMDKDRARAGVVAKEVTRLADAWREAVRQYEQPQPEMSVSG